MNAVQTLLNVCDGACAQDGQGFNGLDSRFARECAHAHAQGALSPARVHQVWRMLRKYRGQLSGFGIDYDSLPVPQPKIIDARGASFRISFPYCSETVQVVKSVSGARFNGTDKTWGVPGYADCARSLQAFVQQNPDFYVSEAAEHLLRNPVQKSFQETVTEKICYWENGKVFFKFPYDPDTIAAVKEIPGRRYCPDTKRWWLEPNPDNPDAIFDVIRSNAFKPTEELVEVISAMRARYERNLADSTKMASDLEVKNLKGTLRPFQKAGVEYMSREKRVFLADEMGLGKTVQAIAALEHNGCYPALIVCPASLKLNWRKEIRKWVPQRPTFVVGSKKKFNDVDYDKCDIVVCNYESLHKLGFTKCPTCKDGTRRETCEFCGGTGCPECKDKGYVTVRKRHDCTHCKGEGYIAESEKAWKSIVFDESHYLKTGKAQRTQAAKALIKKYSIEYRFMLSGTPLPNRPKELITQLNILDRLPEMGGYKYFNWKYCVQGEYLELNEKLRKVCYIRRDKKEVLTELPDKVRSVQTIDLDNWHEYSEAYNDLRAYLERTYATDKQYAAKLKAEGLNEKEIEAALKERAKEKSHAAKQAETLVKINTLRQVAARGKRSDGLAWIDEFSQTGKKLIVFAHHREAQQMLLEHLPKASTVSILGEHSDEQRQKAVERFQNDAQCKVVVCSLKAAGVGLTLTEASDVLFWELGWTPAEMSQAEDRAHRIGQKDSVTAWYLIAENTIDDYMFNLIEEKRQVVDAVTEGVAVDLQASILQDLIKQLRA